MLEAAGAQNRPDAFGPALAVVSARPLSNLSVDDDVADGLFGEVVGRLDVGGGGKGGIGNTGARDGWQGLPTPSLRIRLRAISGVAALSWFYQ